MPGSITIQSSKFLSGILLIGKKKIVQKLVILSTFRSQKMPLRES
jgi:hypothetical protein